VNPVKECAGWSATPPVGPSLLRYPRTAASRVRVAFRVQVTWQFAKCPETTTYRLIMQLVTLVYDAYFTFLLSARGSQNFDT
jgi:hypothetical protein